MENAPIDIQLNKLIDWLQNRRLIKQGWQQQVLKIRSKINNALQDMPEHAEIAKLLSGSYLDLYHAKRIVEVLRDTEANTKNIFGWYGSQRMKDWQEIVQLYEKDNVYLAEEAQTLVRCLTYEIPAATRQIAKLQQLEEDFDRKEVECTKNAQRQRDTFFKMCRDFGLKGEQLQAEFTCLVEELPKLYEDVATAAKGLDGVVNFYEDYLKTVLKLENISDNLAVLRHIVAKGNTTVYEWKYSDPPLKVEAVPFKIESSLLNDERDPAEITTSEAIDFGATDEGGIDFGSTEDGAQGGIDFGEEENGDIDWNSIEMISASELNGDSDNNFEIVVEESGVEGGVARDTEAMTVLDYKRTRVQFIANLLELEGFFEQKLIELNSNSRQFQSLSTPIELSSQQLTEFLTQVREVLSKLEAPKLKNLILMRTSQKYVDRVISNLLHQKSLSSKFENKRSIFVERRQAASEEVAEIVITVKKLGEKMAELQRKFLI
ncbi:CDK5 regulatory subunit-associated protein 3-like isoform X2 [Artemia franciscana]|uniref:CDK5RAP3-like protein n=1 Tax=Artemia franciscana TaxID=6661 RepID=A0AA88I764_ARTSF|nr:hypothetical protein QYM36_003415 [Artemia franciscana]